MANRRRGEIEAVFDGKTQRLCLTLGALAELEAAYQADDLAALVGRFSTGRLAAVDLIRVIGAGLRGGGSDISYSEVGKLQAEGGVAGFAAVAAELLAVTFGSGATAEPSQNP